jgi:hypothetical protein
MLLRDCISECVNTWEVLESTKQQTILEKVSRIGINIGGTKYQQLVVNIRTFALNNLWQILEIFADIYQQRVSTHGTLCGLVKE